MSQKSQPKPRYWNQSILANFLGGSEDDITELRRAVTQLMKSHNKLYKNYKHKAAKNEMRSFFLANVNKLPKLVRDVASNPVRMDGLMGMAIKINNGYKQHGRDRRTATANVPANMSPEQSDHGDEDDVEEDSDNETPSGNDPAAYKAAGDSQPRPATNGTRDRGSTQSSEGTHDRTQGDSQDTGRDRTNDTKSDSSRASDSGANHSSPAVVLDGSHAEEPPSKRIRTIPPPQPFPRPQPQSQPQTARPRFDLLARNIWVVNEIDYESHGLCPTEEIVKNSDQDGAQDHLLISDLDFDRWILIIQAQCGFDYTVHRLEYRPSPAVIMPTLLSHPITVPMRTPSQWRGALNSQLQTRPDQDPVFYMITQCE